MTTESTSIITSSFHSDLRLVKELIYDKCGFDFKNFKLENESQEYGACTFELNDAKIKYRISKITPTKTGQFVTIWKRNNKGITEPFNVTDDFDFIVITSKSGSNIGQFVFPKDLLVKQKIITSNYIKGKRGIRVYPPWDKANSKQAEKTRKWQTEYFITISNVNSLDFIKIKKMLSKASQT